MRSTSFPGTARRKYGGTLFRHKWFQKSNYARKSGEPTNGFPVYYRIRRKMSLVERCRLLSARPSIECCYCENIYTHAL